MAALRLLVASLLALSIVVRPESVDAESGSGEEFFSRMMRHHPPDFVRRSGRIRNPENASYSIFEVNKVRYGAGPPA